MNINCNLKEFMDRYADKYVYRLRKNENTIVYYKGIKAFEIENDGTIIPSTNTFICNPTTMSDRLKEEQDDQYLSDLINLCQNMKVEMNKFDFELAARSNVELVLERLGKYCDKANEISHELINKEDILLQCKQKNKKIEIVFNEKNMLNTEAVIKLQYYFYRLVRVEPDGSLNEDNIKGTTITSKTKIIIDTEDLNVFLGSIENSIDNYKGKECVEKKYQHQFMLQASKSNIFNDAQSIPFEEEYSINKNEDKGGRIDCVFYSQKDNRIKDMYLIELKVNDSVVLGRNGVLTHLNDIQKIVDNSNKCIDFINVLLDRINYSNIIKENGIGKIYWSGSLDDIKIHFYTVFGFTDERDRKNVHDKLIDLTDIEKVKTMKTLDKSVRNSCISSFAEKDYYSIKFYFDKEVWILDKEISNDFDDVTDTYYKKK